MTVLVEWVPVYPHDRPCAALVMEEPRACCVRCHRTVAVTCRGRLRPHKPMGTGAWCR